MQPASVKLLYPLRSAMVGPLRTAIPKLWNPSGKFHLLPELSVAALISQLNERGIDYVSLDFGIKPDGEMELLLRGDDDLDSLQDLVTEWPMGKPLTIYTVSPRNHTAYYPPLVGRASCNRIAVFPPYISEQLLERAVLNKDGLKVLTAEDAFFACAYRAAYMEAGCCDWLSSDARCNLCAAYEPQVRRLAAIAGIALPEPLTPQALDQLLDAHGWRPPLDLLDKAIRWAPWIRDAFADLRCEDEESRTPGLAVFFIRELAIRNGWKQQVLTTLAENGFELLLVEDLDENGRERAARMFRGGDWGAVNLKVSGGRPACIAVGLDLLPQPVDAKYLAKQPEADNLRTIVAKNAARRLVKANVPMAEAFNPVHSTDSSAQAWTTIRLLLPHLEEEVRVKARESRGAFSMNGVVRHLASYGGRAKADVIDLDGTHCVRKAFPPSAAQYMSREIEVMEALAPTCPEIPKLLERGRNYIVVEHVEQDVAAPRPPRPLPFWAVRQLSDFVKKCVAQGFDPIGLKPRDNVVLTSSGIRVIDFEHWRRGDPATPAEKCCALAGQLNGPGETVPNHDPWATQWFPSTALSLHSFLYDPPWLQRLKQAANLAPRYARWLVHQTKRRVLLPAAHAVGRRVVPKRVRSVLRRI